MKIIHSKVSDVKTEQNLKRIPMYKDPVFMAELRKSFIDDHNKKIKSKKYNP